MIPTEDRAGLRRWVGAFAAVLGAHAVPAVVAAWWLGPGVVMPAAEPAILIDLAPLAAPPEPPSDRPPGPKQVKTDVPRPRVQQDPIKTPPVADPAVALPIRLPEPPREDARQVAPETTAPPSRPAPPAPVASSRAPTWQGLVLAQLNRFKRFPTSAQSRRQQGIPYVRFIMDREGKVGSSRLERSSCFRALDDEAVALPRRAQPLPKPPDDVPGQTIELVVPVEFFIGSGR